MKNIHVLPKEKEPVKADLEKEMFELEQELNIPSHLRWHNSKPKQETLEEAFEKWADQQFEKGVGYDKIDVLKFGAKWQAEKMYSEEDLKEAFSMGRTGKTIEDFNIKFKNK